MMLYGLFHAQQFVKRMTEVVLLLAPLTWMELPGPSFADPIMKEIIELQPPYIWGDGWTDRRFDICQKPGTDELCAHPFMKAFYEALKPLPVVEWAF
jgi:hypothetical protein